MIFESGFKIFRIHTSRRKIDKTITISVEQYPGKKTTLPCLIVGWGQIAHFGEKNLKFI